MLAPTQGVINRNIDEQGARRGDECKPQYERRQPDEYRRTDVGLSLSWLALQARRHGHLRSGGVALAGGEVTCRRNSERSATASSASGTSRKWRCCRHSRTRAATPSSLPSS